MVKNPRTHQNPGNVAIGYVRVSTEGVSLEAQSGKQADCRPSLQNAIKDL